MLNKGCNISLGIEWWFEIWTLCFEACFFVMWKNKKKGMGELVYMWMVGCVMKDTHAIHRDKK